MYKVYFFLKILITLDHRLSSFACDKLKNLKETELRSKSIKSVFFYLVNNLINFESFKLLK